MPLSLTPSQRDFLLRTQTQRFQSGACTYSGPTDWSAAEHLRLESYATSMDGSYYEAWAEPEGERFRLRAISVQRGGWGYTIEQNYDCGTVELEEG